MLRETYPFGPSIFCDITRCASYTIWHILPFPYISFWLILSFQSLLLLISLLIVAHIWSCLRVPSKSCLTPGIILPQPLHLARAKMFNGCGWWLRYMMFWLVILPPHGSSAPYRDLLSIYRRCWLVVIAAMFGFLLVWTVVLWLWRFLCWYLNR